MFTTLGVAAQRICSGTAASTLQASTQQANAIVPGSLLSDNTIVIPVVVHVIYNQSFENISQEQIESQLVAINADFNRSNTDFSKVPSVFSKLSGNTNIRFELAKTDPNGRATNGIIRKKSSRMMWSDDDKIKSAAFGGSDAWDATGYLNVWVCNTVPGLSGYASLPGSELTKDGVVVRFDAFGTTGKVSAPFHKGRTLTHEVGHWLGLQHLWGDKQCGDDGIQDTPKQRSGNSGDPVFPKLTACNGTSDGEMFMNFMDFTNDASMGMFTEGQKMVMRAQFSSTGKRNTFLNTKGLSTAWNDTQATAIETTKKQVSIYPNPVVSGNISISLNGGDNTGKHFAIIAANGQIVKTGYFQQAKCEVNVNTLPAGIYQVRLTDLGSNLFAKFVKQ
ncbi:MAG: hypothetical protein RLZZ595_1559 [Bacteroidota bacterium]|jgi:hypothetical protein